jgi:hypothetical protein
MGNTAPVSLHSMHNPWLLDNSDQIRLNHGT